MTYVRLYAGVEGIASNSEVKNVTASLKAFLNPECTVPHPGQNTLAPIKGQWLTLQPGTNWITLLEDLNKSFTFLLPEAWTQAKTIHLEAEIRSSAAAPECSGCVDGLNRLRLTNLTFRTAPSFSECIRTIRTTVKIDGVNYSPTDGEIKGSMDMVRQIYPLDEATVSNTPPMSWLYEDDTGSNDRCGRALAFLELAFFLNHAKDVLDHHGPVAYSALMPSEFPCAGMGNGNKDGGGYNFAGTRHDSAAHETGHSFGLKHCGPPPGHVAECKNENWCDNDWPWPHGTMGPNYGFDILNMRVIKPGEDEHDFHDIMSYGGWGNVWISPRNWIRLYNAMAKHNLPYPRKTAAGGGRGVVNAGDAPTHVVLVRGMMSGEPPAWHFQPIYVWPAEGVVPDAGGEGDYRLELVNAHGEIAATHRFFIPDRHVDMSDLSQSYSPVLLFAEMVPAPGAPEAVVLREQASGQELAYLTRSEQAPTVTVLSPTTAGFDGEPRQPVIRWSATDGDSSDLRALVQYRLNDGRTSDTKSWRTLGVDVAGNELPVFPSELPGGTRAQVRVFVTDGLNTAMAVSPEFAKDNTPPEAVILFPPNDGVFDAGAPIVLKGAGFDLEEGALPGDNLLWGSSLDGVLGVGRTVTADSLTSGVHDIFLWSVDSDFAVSTPAQTTITVRRRLNIQPVADAGEDVLMFPGGGVRLDGLGSRDDDGDSLTYLWTIADAPPGGLAGATLSNPAAPDPIFNAVVEGPYHVRLIVHDGQVGSIPDDVLITVGDAGNVWRVK
ncbi:MAG: hypothetical protein Kow0059_01510 [Candidatus Sumerlaeia bacterium]